MIVETDDGCHLHVETDTEHAPPGAPWVVMLHGALASYHAFRSQRIAIRGHHRIALVDQRGHGASSHFADAADVAAPAPGTPDGPPTVPWSSLHGDRYVDDALAVMAAVSPREPVHLVGVSMGGMVAARTTVAAPERVASLALLSTSGRPSSKRRAFFAATPPEKLAPVTRRLAAQWHGEPYWMDLARHLFGYFADPPGEYYPTRVVVGKALVVQAGEDELLASDEWQDWQRRIAGDVTVVRPPGDHAFFADGRAGSRAANQALRAHLGVTPA